MDFSDKDNNKEVMSIFQVESEEIIERLFDNFFSLESTPNNREIIANVYRDLHSLKGAVRMVGFNNIQNILHKMEDIFDAVNTNKFKLDLNVIKLMSRSLGNVSKYLQESIKNSREIIDDEYKGIISNLEYILDVEIQEAENPTTPPSILSIEEAVGNEGIEQNLIQNQFS